MCSARQALYRARADPDPSPGRRRRSPARAAIAPALLSGSLPEGSSGPLPGPSWYGARLPSRPAACRPAFRAPPRRSVARLHRTGPLSPTAPSKSECDLEEPKRGGNVALAVTAFLPWPGGPIRCRPGGCVGGASDQRHPISGQLRVRLGSALAGLPAAAGCRRPPTGLEVMA